MESLNNDDEGRYCFRVEDGDGIRSGSTGFELDSIHEALVRALEIADELEAKGATARTCIIIENDDGEEVARVLVGQKSN
jgi:hypothetical protein